MSPKSSGKLAATEHLRAMKAQRADELAGQVDPATEARTRERKLLDGLGAAADDLEWLAVNQAWTLLGHDTCAAWWEARVKPVAQALGFEPSRELGMRFVELIRAEEASLPSGQRRSAKELSQLVGVSEWAARGRKETRQRRTAAYVDLDRPVIDSTFTEDTALSRLSAVLATNGPTADVDTEAGRANVEAVLAAIEWALANGGTEELYSSHLSAIEARLSVAGFAAEQVDELVGKYRQFEASAPMPLVAGLRAAITDVAAHTSGAVPPASTEGEAASLSSVDSPDDGVAPPSSSGGTDSPTADPLSDSSSHAGVPAVGGQTPERTEEQSGPWDVVWTSVGNDAEIDRQTFDSHQLAVAEMERSRRAGSIAEVDIEPTPTDSPTGLEAAQPRDDRSETDSSAGPDQPVATTVLPGIDHHDGAGVSRRGEALPVESRPVGALLEDGDAAVTPSSSDPDEDEHTPTDLLLMTFGALINLIDHMDVEAVAPMLFPAELEQMHQHAEALAAFVAKVSRIRFEALTRTP